MSPDAAAHTVRLAQSGRVDRLGFLTLWRPHLEEIYAAGGDLPPTEHNHLEFLKVYDSYVAGSLWGLCTLGWVGAAEGPPHGCLLFGEEPGGWAFDTERPGRAGFLWGVHVEPDRRRQGLAWAMQDWTRHAAEGWDSGIGT